MARTIRLWGSCTVLSLFWTVSSTINGEEIELGLPPSEFQYFQTEPTFQVPFLNVINRTDDPTSLQPGYLFIAPFGPTPQDPVKGYGPMIFDDAGNLVWNGQEQVGYWPGTTYHSRAVNLQVCDYLGHEGSHLCWTEAIMGNYRSIATNRFFDNSYQQVSHDYSAVSGWIPPNEHEFYVVRGGKSFIQAIYSDKLRNLSDFAGPEAGTVIDACFQEVDVETGEERFAWCYLDHFPLSDTKIYLKLPENMVNDTSHIAGNGSFESPWDIAHINSITLTSEGDYLASVRHNDQVIKIAGLDNMHGLEPGEVIWRLGGHGSSFEEKHQPMFSRQHHAHEISVTANESQILLFNNAFEGDNAASDPESSVVVVTLNNATMEAEVTRKYKNPDGLLAYAEGGVQKLANSNILVGWGWVPSISEFAEDGALLYHAQLVGASVHSYRAYKFPWAGAPTQPPKLVAYMQDCTPDAANSLPITAYVSWNGATEVASWRFAASDTEVGPWTPLANAPKAGFETSAYLNHSASGMAAAPWILAEALDSRGRVLDFAVARTWVPSAAVAGYCNSQMCAIVNDLTGLFHNFEYKPEWSRAAACGALPGSPSAHSRLSSEQRQRLSSVASGLTAAIGFGALLVSVWLVIGCLRGRRKRGYSVIEDDDSGRTSSSSETIFSDGDDGVDTKVAVISVKPKRTRRLSVRWADDV